MQIGLALEFTTSWARPVCNPYVSWVHPTLQNSSYKLENFYFYLACRYVQRHSRILLPLKWWARVWKVTKLQVWKFHQRNELTEKPAKLKFRKWQTSLRIKQIHTAFVIGEESRGWVCCYIWGKKLAGGLFERRGCMLACLWTLPGVPKYKETRQTSTTLSDGS